MFFEAYMYVCMICDIYEWGCNFLCEDIYMHLVFQSLKQTSYWLVQVSKQ